MPADAKIRSCCDESSCPRAEIVRLLSPDDPIENDVDQLAAMTAERCPGLNREGLEYCFTRTFEMPPECQLFERFCSAYDAERQTGNRLPPTIS
jgi:hypothetical protein